jgi:lysine 2,3-aminomutase
MTKKTVEVKMTKGRRHGGGPWKGVPPEAWGDWRWQFKNRVRTLRQLSAVMERSVASLAAWGPVIRVYPVAITPYYLSLMDPADEMDPLRKQCFPDPRELDPDLGGEEDPLGEGKAMPVPGLIHRYPDRAWRSPPAPAPSIVGTATANVFGPPGVRQARERLEAMVDHVAGTPASGR